MLLTNEEGDKLEIYDDFSNCKIENWPMTHLGPPVSGSRFKIKDLIFLEEIHFNHLDDWQGG
jgi:hypothetical protein